MISARDAASFFKNNKGTTAEHEDTIEMQKFECKTDFDSTVKIFQNNELTAHKGDRKLSPEEIRKALTK